MGSMGHLSRQLAHLAKRNPICVHGWQTEADVADKKEELAQALFDHIPVGVGSQGIIATNTKDLDTILEMGMDYSVREVVNQSLLCALVIVPR